MKILIIEDEIEYGWLISKFLREKGHSVDHVSRGELAIDSIDKQHYDLIILDLLLPDMNGMDILRKIKEIPSIQEVVVITGHGTIKIAVEAMKLGAFDFLTKPCSLEEVELVVKKVEDMLSLKRENSLLKSEKRLTEEDMIIASPAMKNVVDIIGKIACSDCSVIIQGESGVGKELVAKLIHRLSDRKDKPFVAINISAIPQELLEAELFGYEKGAFTGAGNQKAGFMELAKGGTLFLDEITDLDLKLQAKLLRAIEEKKFYRLGGRREVESDVRIICATNRDIKKLVDDGLFREDLYYRLNTVEIKIPPLRERKEDIIPLVEHFLEKFCRKYNKKIKGFTEKAKATLLSYNYPGNVRELRNIVERAVLLCNETLIDENHLNISFHKKPDSIKEIEKMKIEEVLKRVNFDKRKAAELLDIPLRTFYRKLKKYNLL
ncbi:sigma-54-dependent transcriptional regulator [Pampinifervens florentissimum]|uniref:sigma-54-dependent transcriptional regulator n=1 Tax=Pampinifervens florentissimum TaxID=1632019 RepID=UPI0013B48D4D|nr:sigma-54 dependent transcriptional regulator [Hydrogenobacter sp. T-8]QID32380.1 sigma-54-dependent Fis family transcriptional regulator [Hydrogenobacter sp. T-8]